MKKISFTDLNWTQIFSILIAILIIAYEVYQATQKGENEADKITFGLYGYDISTGKEFEISKNADLQSAFAINGNTVVWSHHRGGIYFLYGYDLKAKSEFEIIKGNWSIASPAIWGDIVVWSDKRNGNSDIYGLNLPTRETFQITTDIHGQMFPSIYQNLVVWEDHRNGNLDIYGYDLNTKTEFQITTDPSSQRYPLIWGDTIIWYDYRNQIGHETNIFGYSVSREREFPIIREYSDKRALALFGNIIVYEDSKYKCCAINIYGYDLSLSMPFRMTSSKDLVCCPNAHVNKIIWLSHEKKFADAIIVHDYPSGKERKIKLTNYVAGYYIDIWGDTIVWVGYTMDENS